MSDPLPSVLALSLDPAVMGAVENGAAMNPDGLAARGWNVGASVAAQPGQDFAPFTIDARHFEAALRMITQSRRLGAIRRLDHAA
jgi:hypothetical protein